MKNAILNVIASMDPWSANNTNFPNATTDIPNVIAHRYIFTNGTVKFFWQVTS